MCETIKGLSALPLLDQASLLCICSNKKANKQSQKKKGNRALADNLISVPALRGKDYGKTKMRYPDYTETESGLQYKVPLPPSADFYFPI